MFQITDQDKLEDPHFVDGVPHVEILSLCDDLIVQRFLEPLDYYPKN